MILADQSGNGEREIANMATEDVCMAGEITTVDVKGLKELDEFLKNLPKHLQRKALAQANLAGAAVIRDEAKLRAPVRADARAIRVGKNSTKATLPGFLKASIRAWRLKKGSTSTVSHAVGVSGKAYYGKFIEFGTRHISARPFLRPALDAAYLRAIDAVGKVLKQKIEREIAKQARGK